MDLQRLARERNERIRISQDPNTEVEENPVVPPEKKLSTAALVANDPENWLQLRTGLTDDQMEEIEDIVRETMAPTGPGPRGPDMRARLVVLMRWMDDYPSFKMLSLSFRCSQSQIARSIQYALEGTEIPLTLAYLPRRKEEISCKEKFKYHRKAFGAVDATVFPILRPGLPNESDYYSGKHKIHCLKVQALVTPDGQCVHLSEIIPGATHDRILFTQSGLGKFLATSYIDERGLRADKHPKILADLGYQGVQHEYSEIELPFKRQPGKELTREQEIYNNELSSDRLIVENYFGRLKAYYKILTRPYRGSIDSFKSVIRIAFALTNMRIKSAPLRAGEHQPEIEVPEGSPELVTRCGTGRRRRRQEQE